MKKFLSWSLAMLMLVVSMSTISTAEVINDDEKEIINYNEQYFEVSELSQTTLDWLEWYNALPDDLKQMVNHEPYELEAKLSQEPVSLIKQLNTTQDSGSDLDVVMSFAQPLLETSGYEPVYNPDYWNKSENIERANCYAYAMDVLKKTKGKLQPGDVSGERYTSLTKSAIQSAVKADGPYLGSGRKITNSSRDAVPGKNQYKVALVIAPNVDYHWYIQNRDGYWSHKRGYSEVTNVDASGNRITDPGNCDRNYGYGMDYSTFCGYYLVEYTNK